MVGEDTGPQKERVFCDGRLPTTKASATARKLGVIIWTMIIQKVAYKPPTEYLFLDQKRKQKLVERIKKNITKFDLKPDDFNFVTP